MMIILVIHLGLTIVVGLAFWHSSADRLRALAEWLIIAFFPAGGLLVVWILEHHQPDQKKEVPSPSLEAAMEDDAVTPRVSAIDIRVETNVAPLQEILLVADYERRREVLLDILKTDAFANAGCIEQALQNEDSETAHYAASGLQYVRQKLDARLHEMASRYEVSQQDPHLAAAYADLLHQYLTSFKLDPATRQQYLHDSIQILSQLAFTPDLTIISRLVEQLLAVGYYQQARQYCKLLAEYPDSETKYLVLLKSFFLMKDKTHFDQVFEQFRASDVSFSNEVLNIIRLWLGAIK